MARTTTPKAAAAKTGTTADPFKLRGEKEAARDVEPLVHIIREGIRCDTERRGHQTPQGRPPVEIVVDATEGFIPLWAKGTTLRWRFRESSLQPFANPAAARAAITRLLGRAILEWGSAAPIKFAQRNDAWDFEIVVRRADDCDNSGCVLASAFFPDAGRHKLVMYPKMFTQDAQEQLETLVHEIGHIFGLRHFFAQVSEEAWPSEIFGKHVRFSIMNYGGDSKLTAADKADLKKLYKAAWAGTLTEVNGTPIKLVKPFHASGESLENVVFVEPMKSGFPAPTGATMRGQ